MGRPKLSRPTMHTDGKEYLESLVTKALTAMARAGMGEARTELALRCDQLLLRTRRELSEIIGEYVDIK